MNSKFLSMMIISVCIFGQIKSSESSLKKSESFLKKIDKDTWLKIRLISGDKLHESSGVRIFEFNEALENDDYYLALRILNNFSTLQRDIYECNEIEKKVAIRETTLSLLLMQGVPKEEKEKIQESLQQLQLITALVQKQKVSAKEIAYQPRSSCALQ